MNVPTIIRNDLAKRHHSIMPVPADSMETIVAIVRTPAHVEKLHPIFEGSADIHHPAQTKVIHFNDTCTRYARRGGFHEVRSNSPKIGFRTMAVTAFLFGFAATALTILSM